MPVGLKLKPPGKPTRIFLPGKGHNPLTVGIPRHYCGRMSIQRARLLGLVGILGGLFWLALNTVLSPDWGPPGSSSYLGYETISRLWAPAFAGMLCSFVGLNGRYRLGAGRLSRFAYRLTVVGLVVMILGNVAEFWLFTELPYGAMNARSLAWISVLLGWLTLLIGVCLLALAGLQRRLWPAWSGILLALALPASLVLIFTVTDWMGWPLIIAVVLAGGLAAQPAPAAGRVETASLQGEQS